MKTLALFDFDGTLYKKDSLLEFTKFAKGFFEFYKGILLLSPYLIGLKLGLLNNEKVKIRFITYFFKGLEIEKFNSLAKSFSLEKIDQDLNKKIFLKFKEHINSNHQVFIITASIPEWIIPWSNQYKVKVIGTKLEIIDSEITGKFSSKNCFGGEKVTRLKELINLNEYDQIFVYGSGKGDFQLLSLARN